MLKNKEAQIASTITWAVATVIIVVVLIVFIFASDVLFGIFEVKRLVQLGSEGSVSDEEFLASISLAGFLQTSQGQDNQRVYDVLSISSNLDKVNGPLAKEIFNVVYPSGYENVWVGFISGSIGRVIVNDYFPGGRPKPIRRGDVWTDIIANPINAEFKFNEEKKIEVITKQKNEDE